MLRVADHFQFSDTGRQRRHNEDAFYARSPVFVVADGMGGAQAGEVASRTAVEAFAAGVPDAGSSSAEQALAGLVRQANERIHAMSRADEARAGMGTTLTAAHVGEHEVAIAHVGDSRAYRLRDGALERLTEDHSLVEELRRQGKLTASEADEHPQRSIITRALGPEPEVAVDTHSWPAEAGDVYLLCSDGLTSMVDEEAIGALVRSSASLAEAARGLVRAANDAGGRDNITVVLFRLEDAGAAPAAETGEQPSVASEPGAPPSTESSPVVAEAPTQRLRARAPDGPTAAPAPAADPAPVRRRRRRRVTLGLALGALVVVPVLIGAYVASQAVYFIGTDPQGFVTMYRGLPYELPAGIDLYKVNYVSGLRARALPQRRRARLLDHQLRSRDDAADLVRQLERGRITS